MHFCLIDDDPHLLATLRAGLIELGHECETYQSATDGLERLLTPGEFLPDIVLLDVMMPELDGWELLERLRSAGSKTPVIFVTARGEVDDRVRGLMLTADDYVVKPFNLKELLARAAAVVRRHGYLEPIVLGDLVIHRNKARVEHAGRSVALSQREHAFLELLGSEPVRVFNRQELLAKLWEIHFDPNTNVVDVLVARTRKKLGPTAASLIQTVPGEGYRIAEQGPGMSNAERRPWSLARRLTRWISCSVVLVLGLECAIAYWFVDVTLHRGLDALLVEEEAELWVSLLENTVSEDFVQQLGKRLDKEHPEANISIRVFRARDQRPWVAAGAQPRVPWPGGGVRSSVGNRSVDIVRWAADSHPVRLMAPEGGTETKQIRAELLIDGDPWRQSLTRIAALVLLLSAGVGVGVWVAGFVLSRRLASLLNQVAQGAANAHADGHHAVVAPPRAPEEVHAVSAAFTLTLEQLSSRHARNLLLTAGLAHELRAPLQNLISDAEVGLLRERDGEEYRTHIAAQLAELRKLALVVDNLITLSALRDRERFHRDESFDLATEARIRLVHEEQEAARRGVTIEVIELGDCRCFGDREALVLMLRNLVGNAVSWTAPDSTVDVTMGLREGRLVVTVDDEGPGVPEAEAEAIFEAFYRGTTPVGRRAGYGLGLALARTAARASGGDIEVGTSPGGGGRFTVVLPVRERQAGAGRRTNVAGGSRRGVPQLRVRPRA